MGSSESLLRRFDNRINNASKKEKAAAYLLGGTLAFCGSQGVAKSVEATQQDKMQTVAQSINDCSNPSKSQSETVKKQIKSISYTKTKLYESDWGALDAEVAKRQEVAKKNGLTIIDHRPYFTSFVKDSWKPQEEQMPFSAYFSVAKEFLKNYNVNLELNVNDNNTENKNDSLTSKDLETYQAKINMLTLIDTFAKLPVEFIHDSGLTKIVLTQLTDASGRVTQEDPGTIFAKPTGPLTGVFKHELFHLWIANAGCDTDKDQAYANLNPACIYPNHKPYLSIEEYNDKKRNILKRFFTTDDTNNKNKFQELNAELAELAKKLVVTQRYSFTKVGEDEATMGEILLDPNKYYFFMKGPQSPVLENKFALLAGRIYQKSPNVWNYMFAMGQQPFYE